MWPETQDGKGTDKLDGHTEGPFLVLDRTTRTSVIQLDLVERVHSDRVGRAPAPTTTEALLENDGNMEATTEDLNKKNHSGENWLVNEVMDHRRSGEAVELKVYWKGDYAPASEPRENIPEELISPYIRRR